jgi:mersacidin/lichenicidin family type 2 lantibiotic
MSYSDIVRAWKDPEYRLTLNEMPPHPAGQIELADPDLDGSSAVAASHGVHTHHHCMPTSATLVCGCPPTLNCL